MKRTSEPRGGSSCERSELELDPDSRESEDGAGIQDDRRECLSASPERKFLANEVSLET
jgi:hypothetical protein